MHPFAWVTGLIVAATVLATGTSDSTVVGYAVHGLIAVFTGVTTAVVIRVLGTARDNREHLAALGERIARLEGRDETP